eukprot:TRINITY_DN817_c0_g3_i3.p1 TRINITY_DN817_c0_g3~~TRINITY_DN817_c0_g3_i3.p1  ORF type:complete len:649 (-),score=157.99 TRINITY_DN817_c0_g3_i3:141-2087(-)
MFIAPSQSSDPFASFGVGNCVKVLPNFVNASTQTEDATNPDLYERLFLAMNQPVIVIDISSSHEESEPFLLNPAASILIDSSKDDFYQESHLEKFNASLGNFIRSVRGKVAQEVSYTDVFHTMVSMNASPCELIFALTATTFQLRNATRILAILLMETSRLVKEELNTLESFKNSLISALSHELNNPINSLIPLIKLMPSTSTENGDDLKSMALSSACILRNKIRDLIDYASIEMKSLKLEVEEFYVEDLFEELKRIFRIETEGKRNALKFGIVTCSNRKLKILADRNRLEQILIKLISNANKYTEGGVISISAEENQANFDIVFTVKDTGMGIPSDRLALMFAPLNHKYKQAEEYARLPGLGLEITKGICQCMDSRLSVESTVGRGTVFSFEVPTCRLSTFASQELEDSPDGEDEFQVAEMESTRYYSTEMDEQRGVRVASKSFFSRKENRFGIRKELILNPRSPSCGEKALKNCNEVMERIVRYNYYVKKDANSVFNRPRVVTNFRARRYVLVTDDEYSNRLVLKKMLEHFRIESMEANNGEEAANIVEQSYSDDSPFKIALILMDLHMPIMNGVNATIKIRKLEREYKKESSVPIVAVTAHDGVNNKRDCFNAGMQEYIVKPATSKALKQIVVEFIPDLMGAVIN